MKNSKTIFATAEGMENFTPWDLKKKEGYKLSCDIAARLGFYRQNFCGCEFSKK
jgi:predicted adenine nucleotide alpha hydrolase (AANH) superfamily ATPase